MAAKSLAVSEPATNLVHHLTATMHRLLPGKTGGKIAVALSGGPDSMALVLAAADWTKERGIDLVALTVDHGLRKESAAEAAKVADWMAAAKIAHHTLTTYTVKLNIR